MVHPSGHINGQALPGILIDNRQDPERPAIMGVVEQEVIGPDMITVLRPQPETGAIIEPESPPFRLP